MRPIKNIEIDGKEWPVVVTTNTLIEAEELTGRNIITSGTDSLLRPSLTVLRALLYVVLRSAGAKYTLAQVGEFITIDNTASLRDAFVYAWSGVEVGAGEAVDPAAEDNAFKS